MSESPDIPALIESLQMMEDLNDLPLKPRHRRTLRGAIDALAALSVSQPTTASREEASSVIVCEQTWRKSKDEHAESWPQLSDSEQAILRVGFFRGWDSLAALPSVPLAVTAEQIAEAADLAASRIPERWVHGTFSYDENAPVRASFTAAFIEGAEWLLARSGGAPNFNSQPDLKETGTSGGAPTAQQVPSVEEIEVVAARALYEQWRGKAVSDEDWEKLRNGENRTVAEIRAKVVATAVRALLNGDNK